MVGSIGLFLLAALGALLTVYLAKQEVIPEFRAIYDTSDDEIEVSQRQDHIKKKGAAAWRAYMFATLKFRPCSGPISVSQLWDMRFQ
jgi:hypothetical protein